MAMNGTWDEIEKYFRRAHSYQVLCISNVSVLYKRGAILQQMQIEIDIETVMTRKLQIILLIDNDAVDIRRNGKTWTPIRSLYVWLLGYTHLALNLVFNQRNPITMQNFTNPRV